jgi:hypothetical protein
MKLSPDVMKMVFGFCLLGIIAGLATAVAIGHVEERTSYGLMPLLTTLSTLGGVFSQWAFGHSSNEKPKDPLDKKE